MFCFKYGTALLFAALTISNAPIQDSQRPQQSNILAIVVDGAELEFQSLEQGAVIFKGADGGTVSKQLAELAIENQKLVMDASGWGRVWESSSGGYHTVADLIQVVENAVVLERIDGDRIVVPIEKLSKTDIAYVEARRQLTAESLPERFKAKVVGLYDGDTVTVLLNRRQYKIRLSGIDAPEIGQDYGQKSKKYLGDLIQGKTISGTCEETDKYGRNVCMLEIDGKRVDLEMLKAGLAWHFVKYSKDSNRQQFEDEAKANRLNIWSEAGPIEPWEWRRWGASQRKQWLAEKTGMVEETDNPESQMRGKPDTTQGEQSPSRDGEYWLTTNSNVRHNKSCRWYQNSKGRPCTSMEGHACSKCGG